LEARRQDGGVQEKLPIRGQATCLRQFIVSVEMYVKRRVDEYQAAEKLAEGPPGVHYWVVGLLALADELRRLTRSIEP
jgi:hypothetical protein